MEIFYKILLGIFKINTALAQGGGPATPGGGGQSTFTLDPPVNVSSIQELLKNIASYIYGISLAVAVIMILYGAFQILTSAGDPKKATDGKNTIIYTIVGLAIVILATGIVSLVIEILGANP